MGTVHDDAIAQGWVAGALNVLTLDELWTHHLKSTDVQPDEMQALADLGESLQSSWLQVTDAGALKWLREYVYANAERVAEGAAAADLPDMPEEWANADAVRTKAVLRIDQLLGASGNEDERLSAKIATLRDGSWVSGDLSRVAVCLLLAVSAITTFAIGQALIGGFLATWFTTGGCPQALVSPA
ncbi:hypothetical protein [Streptomyces sp. NPDC002889]|uniref:hypothetical protein n=1 Tax=Streptomyces sp. NPDC002889 TaxID=3364669 RepID=UPI00367A7325